MSCATYLSMASSYSLNCYDLHWNMFVPWYQSQDCVNVTKLNVLTTALQVMLYQPCASKAY